MRNDFTTPGTSTHAKKSQQTFIKERMEKNTRWVVLLKTRTNKTLFIHSIYLFWVEIWADVHTFGIRVNQMRITLVVQSLPVDLDFFPFKQSLCKKLTKTMTFEIEQVKEIFVHYCYVPWLLVSRMSKRLTKTFFSIQK